MKKAFTLIELIAVIIIIAIIIWTVSIRTSDFRIKKDTKQEIVNIYNEINNHWRNLIRWKESDQIIISWNDNQLFINWENIISSEFIEFGWTGLSTWYILSQTWFQDSTISIYKQWETWEIAYIKIEWEPINEINLNRTENFE